MTRNVVFDVPEHMVHVPLDSAAGAVVAAQQALGRFRTAVSRADADFEERIFSGFSVLALQSKVDDLFVVIPDPPELGAFGAVTVRYYPGGTREDVNDLVSASAGGDRFVLEPPDVSVRPTRIGDGTRNLLRWTDGEPTRRQRIRKQEMPITEQLSWYWCVEDDVGDSVVINLTCLTQDLPIAVLLRPVVDRFASERITLQ